WRRTWAPRACSSVATPHWGMRRVCDARPRSRLPAPKRPWRRSRPTARPWASASTHWPRSAKAIGPANGSPAPSCSIRTIGQCASTSPARSMPAWAMPKEPSVFWNRFSLKRLRPFSPTSRPIPTSIHCATIHASWPCWKPRRSGWRRRKQPRRRRFPRVHNESEASLALMAGNGWKADVLRKPQGCVCTRASAYLVQPPADDRPVSRIECEHLEKLLCEDGWRDEFPHWMDRPVPNLVSHCCDENREIRDQQPEDQVGSWHTSKEMPPAKPRGPPDNQCGKQHQPLMSVWHTTHCESSRGESQEQKHAREDADDG